MSLFRTNKLPYEPIKITTRFIMLYVAKIPVLFFSYQTQLINADPLSTPQVRPSNNMCALLLPLL